MELSAVLRQNVTTLAGLADDMLWQSSVHPILIRAGWSMEGAGLADSALRYWIGLRSISEQRLGRKHPDTLTIRRELAYCLGQSGKPAVAVTELEGLLDDFLQVLGPRSRETLTLRRYLDWWRGETRDPFGAVAAYEKLRDDALHVLGSDDIETLTARYNLGRWRGQAGRPDQAIDDLEALLDDCRRVIGPDGLLTLDVRHDLAWWYGESGDLLRRSRRTRQYFGTGTESWGLTIFTRWPPDTILHGGGGMRETGTGPIRNSIPGVPTTNG